MIEQSVRRLYDILESYTEINLSLWLEKLKYSSLKYTLRGFYTKVREGRTIATMETNTVQTYQLKKGKKACFSKTAFSSNATIFKLYS